MSPAPFLAAETATVSRLASISLDSADRIDLLVHQLMRISAPLTGVGSDADRAREMADALCGAAEWLGRCSKFPALADVLLTLERGGTVYCEAAPLTASAVVVRDEDHAPSRPGRWRARISRLLHLDHRFIPEPGHRPRAVDEQSTTDQVTCASTNRGHLIQGRAA